MKKVILKLIIFKRNFIKNESGSGLLESIILLFFISIFALTAVHHLGLHINSEYTSFSSKVRANM